MSFNPSPSSDAPVSEDSLRAFHRAVNAHFRPIAHKLGLEWQIVCPWIESFSTPVIQVTVRVVREDYPNVFVLLRPNTTPAPLGSMDGFGLSWVQEFITGQRSSDVLQPCWEPEAIVAEVERLAEQFRQFALPLIASESTDWSEIQRYVLAGVEANIAATFPMRSKRKGTREGNEEQGTD